MKCFIYVIIIGVILKINFALLGYVSEEEKENVHMLEEEKALEVSAKRRKLRSSTLEVDF